MSRRVSTRQEEQRRAVLTEWERSGPSVASFARERGLSPWMLYKWRRRVAELGAPDEVQAAPEFVQLTVRPAEAPRSAIQIELDGGMRVNVPAGFDEGELRRLLEVPTSCLEHVL